MTTQAFKTFGWFLVVATLATGSGAAFAARCTDAQDINRNESNSINDRNHRINQLAAEAMDEQRRIDNEVKPNLNVWKHAIRIQETKIESLREALGAIQQVGAYLEETVSSDASLKLVLDQIRNSQRLSPDRRLAEQLRIIARTGYVRTDARESLLRFANTVTLLEKTHAEFAAAEVQLIEDYLKGRNTLVNGMLDTLNHIRERLSTDIQQAELAANQDRATAADLTKQIADSKVRQDARGEEIWGLGEANRSSKNKMDQWKIEDNCDLQPRIGRGLYMEIKI